MASTSSFTPGVPVDITGPDHFTSIMSADLGRVTLLNFWAPWAEPCKAMNEVVAQLAAKYPQVAVLNVEAEAQPDVSDSFDIESVPCFVLLRGHTLLSRISGANAQALNEALAQHVTGPAASSSASTAATPASGGGAYTPGADEEEPREETEQEIDERCKALMNKGKVVLFMKGTPDAPRCGFSQKTVALLRQQGVDFDYYDILQDEGVRQGMKKLNDWPTFPQIIVGGELIGGLDILKVRAPQGLVDEGRALTLMRVVACAGVSRVGRVPRTDQRGMRDGWGGRWLAAGVCLVYGIWNALRLGDSAVVGE